MGLVIWGQLLRHYFLLCKMKGLGGVSFRQDAIYQTLSTEQGTWSG